MKLKIQNGKKYDLDILKEELGTDFTVVQAPHTVTGQNNKVTYFDLEIEVDDAAAKEKDLQKICDAHSPEIRKPADKLKIALIELLSDPDVIKLLKKELNG